MKKSFKSNGHIITFNNFIKFAKSDAAFYGSNLLLDYLCKLENVADFPKRLDSWTSDYSSYTYQVGNKWFYIYDDEKQIINDWLKNEKVNACY